jgi:hypothetical protein
MKKVIRLSESDLMRIVKRVINESEKGILIEQVEYEGVQISPANKQYGGPVMLTYNGKSIQYSINVVVTKLGINVYKGKIGVVAFWKSPNGYFAKDNTNKVFQIPPTELQKMVRAAKTNANKVNISGTGEVAGVSGNYNATLTKVS